MLSHRARQISVPCEVGFKGNTHVAQDQYPVPRSHKNISVRTVCYLSVYIRQLLQLHDATAGEPSMYCAAALPLML